MKERLLKYLAILRHFIHRVLLSLGAMLLAAWFGLLGYLWGSEAWEMGDPPMSVLAVLALAVSAFFISRIPSPWLKRPDRGKGGETAGGTVD